MIYLGDFRLAEHVQQRARARCIRSTPGRLAPRGEPLDRRQFRLRPRPLPRHRRHRPLRGHDASVAELNWIADHRFVGIYGPGVPPPRGHAAPLRPLLGPLRRRAERNIAIVNSAKRSPSSRRSITTSWRLPGAPNARRCSRDADAVTHESNRNFFFQFLAKNIASRRHMWQMMFGGFIVPRPGGSCFPRIPLTGSRRRLPTQLRGASRHEMPAQRKPSDVEHQLSAGASFIHKAEVERRHELGVQTILFGRDIPRTPRARGCTRRNSGPVSNVPEDELRLMSGCIRFFKLDEGVAQRDRQAHRPIRGRHQGRTADPAGAVGDLRQRADSSSHTRAT